MRQKPFIIVRGGGDLATGTIHRLWAAGFPVLVLETDHPAAIRRQVAVCEAVYEGSATVEGMEAVLIKDTAEAKKVIDTGKVPLIVDPDGASITALKPDVVVDAILAKKNFGTNRSMAPLTVGLGPGFTAGMSISSSRPCVGITLVELSVRDQPFQIPESQAILAVIRQSV